MHMNASITGSSSSTLFRPQFRIEGTFFHMVRGDLIRFNRFSAVLSEGGCWGGRIFCSKTTVTLFLDVVSCIACSVSFGLGVSWVGCVVLLVIAWFCSFILSFVERRGILYMQLSPRAHLHVMGMLRFLSVT